MKRVAVFPGSFDPVTQGHYRLVVDALELFDHIIVALGVNTSKTCMFSSTQRLGFLEKTFQHLDKVTVDSFEGLTIDFCQAQNAQFILRGLRNTQDFEYEKSIAQMNKKMNAQIDTVFLMASQDNQALSSSILRELIKNNKNVDPFLPEHLSYEDLC